MAERLGQDYSPAWLAGFPPGNKRLQRWQRQYGFAAEEENTPRQQEPRYAMFHVALRAATADLIRLRFAMRDDPVAEATFIARVRHIQSDARRLWLPLVLGQAKTTPKAYRRPRLRLAT